VLYSFVSNKIQIRSEVGFVQKDNIEDVQF